MTIPFLHIVEGRRFGQYPIGFPLALVPWVMVGLPWALNVLLAGVSLVLMHRFAFALGGAALAWTSTALLAVSPFFILNSTIFLSHPLLLVLMQIVLAALVLRESEPGRTRWSVLAGAAVGYALNVSPFAAVPMGLVIGARLLSRRRQQAILRREIVTLALPILAGVAAYCAVNAATMGSPLKPAYFANPEIRPGFGEDAGPGGHSLGRAWLLTVRRLRFLDNFLSVGR